MSHVDPDSGERVRLVLRPLTSASGLLTGPDGQVFAGAPVRVFPMLKTRQEGITTYTMWNTEWSPPREPVKAAADGAREVRGLVGGGMYAVQPEAPDARFDLAQSIFEVDREGKPTDLGLMTMQ